MMTSKLPQRGFPTLSPPSGGLPEASRSAGGTSLEPEAAGKLLGKKRKTRRWVALATAIVLLILKHCAKKRYIQLKFNVSGDLRAHMLVRAFKSWIKKATSLQRIHASISERGRVDANVCFGSTGRSK
jgi:hypothetical protein